MSYSLDLGNGKRLDLGPTLEFFKAMGQMGRFDLPGKIYPHLYGLVHMSDQPTSKEYRQLVRSQAVQMLADHGGELGPHAKWILQQLVENIRRTAKNGGIRRVKSSHRSKEAADSRRRTLAGKRKRK